MSEIASYLRYSDFAEEKVTLNSCDTENQKQVCKSLSECECELFLDSRPSFPDTN